MSLPFQLKWAMKKNKKMGCETMVTSELLDEFDNSSSSCGADLESCVTSLELLRVGKPPSASDSTTAVVFLTRLLLSSTFTFFLSHFKPNGNIIRIKDGRQKHNPFTHPIPDICIIQPCPTSSSVRMW